VSRSRHRVVIQPVARSEVAEAAAWYESQVSGLGRDFLGEFRAAVARLRENPHQYQPLDELMRRLLTRRFPYSVYFEIDGPTVVIHACVHQARDPAAWQNRST
jgi:plasmid stabilization system protein ParE